MSECCWAVNIPLCYLSLKPLISFFFFQCVDCKTSMTVHIHTNLPVYFIHTWRLKCMQTRWQIRAIVLLGYSGISTANLHTTNADGVNKGATIWLLFCHLYYHVFWVCSWAFFPFWHPLIISVLNCILQMCRLNCDDGTFIQRVQDTQKYSTCAHVNGFFKQIYQRLRFLNGIEMWDSIFIFNWLVMAWIHVQCVISTHWFFLLWAMNIYTFLFLF